MNDLLPSTWSECFNSANKKSTLEIITANPNILNSIKGDKPLTQYLIEKKEYMFLQKFAKYIDLSLDCSTGINILMALSQADFPSTMEMILKYQPEVINKCGSNNIYPLEYLIKNNQEDTIQQFAKYIDVSKPASNGMNLLGLLIKKEWPSTLNKVLKYQSHLLNTPDSLNIYPCEYLIKNNYYNTIQLFAKHIDFSKPASNRMNLLGLLIKKEWPSTLNKVLKYNPQVINFCGENNVYPVEYLIKHNCHDTIQSYVKCIDFTLPSTSKTSLFTLLMKKDWPTTTRIVLAAHPLLVKEKEPKAFPVKIVKIEKEIVKEVKMPVIEEVKKPEVILKPMSKYRKLL